MARKGSSGACPSSFNQMWIFFSSASWRHRLHFSSWLDMINVEVRGIVTSECFDSLILSGSTLGTLQYGIAFLFLPTLAWSLVAWFRIRCRAVFGSLFQGEKRRGPIAGVAPFYAGNRGFFYRQPALCDYLDFVIVPGKRLIFSISCFDDLQGRGIKRLNLSHWDLIQVCLTYLVVLQRIGIMIFS